MAENTPTTRLGIYYSIDLERASQDTSWRTGRPNEDQYAYAAPHILLLEEQVAKLRSNWYGARDESTLRERLVKVAALAVRALEEIKITN
jgi:hypothetical protein